MKHFVGSLLSAACSAVQESPARPAFELWAAVSELQLQHPRGQLAFNQAWPLCESSVAI